MEHHHVDTAWLRAKYGGRTGGAHARHPELYPLIACVGLAVALFGFYNAHDLAENPDMNLRRHRRETPTWQRFREDEGEHFMHHRASIAHMRVNPVNRAATSIDDEKAWGSKSSGKLYE